MIEKFTIFSKLLYKLSLIEEYKAFLKEETLSILYLTQLVGDFDMAWQ